MTTGRGRMKTKMAVGRCASRASHGVRSVRAAAVGRPVRSLPWLTIALALLVSGCALRTPPADGRVLLGDDHRAAPVEVEWPARDVAALLAVAERARVGVVSDNGRSIRFNRTGSRLLYGDRRHMYGPCITCGHFGRGVVFEPWPAPSSGARTWVVLVNDLPVDELHNAVLQPEPTPTEERHVSRYRFVLRQPDARPARGLVVHFISLGDRRYERAVLEALRRRGWATLTATPGGFTISYARKDDQGEWKLVDEQDRVAELDSYLADAAYALESLLAYLDAHRPDVRADPLVFTAFSMGTFAAPASAARLGDRVDAAVFVGGGANLGHILTHGSLSGPAMRTMAREIGPEARAALRSFPDAWMRESRFDPFHAAPALRRVPVLMLHAAFDAIVPASTGDLLYERLGRPERWTYPLGHLGLFWWLPNEAEAIADWIDRAVGPQHAAGASR